MKNWQITQYLSRKELGDALNEIEEGEGLKIEQLVILERWKEGLSPTFYRVLYRLADLPSEG